MTNRLTCYTRDQVRALAAERFATGMERSGAYRAGYEAAMMNNLCSGCRLETPVSFTAGTTSLDAYLAGYEEGRRAVRRILNGGAE